MMQRRKLGLQHGLPLIVQHAHVTYRNQVTADIWLVNSGDHVRRHKSVDFNHAKLG